jgi:uncharacterized phage protein gp47/JayE
MQNLIDGSGIQIQTYQDILDSIIQGSAELPGLISIYGTDINVASNTPDGNLINIFALSKEDVLQLCVSIYDSFDPDQAVGTALDNISQLCGITREGGSYTEVSIVLVATQAVNLYGLDSNGTVFIISDSSGNEFYLEESQTISGAGTYTYTFRAADMGFVQAAPNTITNIVTVTPGVATVNNPNEPLLLGQDQETDASFRIRRQNSVAIPSQGAFYGLYAGLLTISGLEQAVVYTNNTNSTDSKSVLAHSIWVITDGGSSTDIGNMIYNYLNLGCGMKGNKVVNITQIDGSIFPVYYDTAVYQSVYATMHITSKSGGSIDTSGIANYLSDNYILGIYEAADITALAALLHTYSSDLVMSAAGVSLSAGSYGTSVWPSAYTNKLLLYGTNIAFT